MVNATPVTGLDVLRAAADGTIETPPAAALLGWKALSLEPGRVRVREREGEGLAEGGLDLDAWEPPGWAAGVPQVLDRCLGRAEGRYAGMADLVAALDDFLRGPPSPSAEPGEALGGLDPRQADAVLAAMRTFG